LTIANNNTGNAYDASVSGIVIQISNNVTQTVSGNTIYNLSNTNVTFAGNLRGIFYYCPGTGSTVSGNFIHSLSTSSTTIAQIWALYVYYSGTTTFFNNIVNLGGDTPNSLRGIVDRQNGTNSYYFNTVYLGGTSTSGGQHSIAMLCGGYSDIKNIRNNLFINARSNSGSANGTHYAVFLDYLNAKTIEYNDYYASGTGGKLGYLGPTQYNTLSAWQTATGQDGHSLNISPAFTPSNPGTAAANYATTATLPGVAISGITTDYFGTTRDATPKMGAYEGVACTNPTGGGTIAGAQTICSGFVPAAFTTSADPSGQTGTLEYKWQISTTSNSSGFADISPAATSATYAPGALSATSWYKRLSKVTCDATWPAAGASNVLQITVNSSSFTPATFTVGDLHATGSGIKWYAASSGGAALASGASISNGTTYYASQTVSTVESSARFPVAATILSTPCAPTGSASQSHVTGATVASLQATGTSIRWYAAASGGAALATSTALVSGNHYYATQTVSCTESATRLAVTVTVN
jgi:hypothetical protein